MKLGRLPRGRLTLIPHMSALLAGVVLPDPPPSVDYTTKLDPSKLGVMLNDSLGDCTCAAFYHAIQVWSSNTGRGMNTQADKFVLQLYEKACGYNPNDPSTDQGGVEQNVLTYVYQYGAPVPGGTHKISYFVEVDPRNQNDVKLAIMWCGGVYIGFNVPAYLMSNLTAAGSTWDVDASGDNSIVGGHAVFLPGYTAEGPIVISWGNLYQMTWAFFAQFVDEAYGIADKDWIEETGETVGGLPLATLLNNMRALDLGASFKRLA